MVQAIATTAYRKFGKKDTPLMAAIPTLEKMLWGGTIMLIVDHILNGELTWAFPFFTALSEANGGQVILHEMLTVGVPMSLVITAVWGVWALWTRRKAVSA